MRKMVAVSWVLIALALMIAVGVAAAQDTKLEPGQLVEGKITSAASEVAYKFTGKKDDIVLVEMYNKPGTFELRPAVILRDSSNNLVAQNEGFVYSSAVIVAKLAADGDYSVVATREGGAGGTSEGEYVLRAQTVTPLKAGDKAEASVLGDTDKALPTLFVIAPEANGPVSIGFSQPISELYASLELREWKTENLGSTVMSLDSTAKVSEASAKVELEGGKYYVLAVRKALLSFVLDNSTVTKVSITLN
jgi:hypothetical protein